jgi:hypothetical protein
MPRDYKRVLEERAGDEASQTSAPATLDGQATTTSGPVAVGATADA